MANLRHQIAKLTALAKLKAEERQPALDLLRIQQARATAWETIRQRFESIVNVFYDDLTDDEAIRLCDAIGEWAAEEQREFYTSDAAGGALRHWLSSLLSGASRLPELSPDVLRQAILSRLNATVEQIDEGETTCMTCGFSRLRCPAEQDQNACPHCGGTATVFPYSFDTHPWQTLDGVVPRVPRPEVQQVRRRRS